MKVFIATIGNEWWNRELADEFRALAASDRTGKHSLTENPELADVILFVDLHQHGQDWNLKGVRRHPLARFERKVMVYDERDHPHCVFPGLFVSMPARYFDPTRQRAVSYYRLKNELIQPSTGAADLLFSFMGAKSHPVRVEILKLEHPRAHIEDTSKINFFDFSANSDTEQYKSAVRAQKERYEEIAARSKFVLCPRGAGASSFRLYETLAAGRVPVIVSDDWVPSRAGDWNACSIRVAQSEVASIPALLEQKEAEWPEMARAARHIFDEWIAPDVLFSRLMDECEWLLLNGQLGRKPFQIRDAAFRRSAARHALNNLRRLRAKLRRS